MVSGSGITHISYWVKEKGFDEVRLVVAGKRVAIPTLSNNDLEQICIKLQKVIDDYKD